MLLTQFSPDDLLRLHRAMVRLINEGQDDPDNLRLERRLRERLTGDPISIGSHRTAVLLNERGVSSKWSACRTLEEEGRIIILYNLSAREMRELGFAAGSYAVRYVLTNKGEALRHRIVCALDELNLEEVL